MIINIQRPNFLPRLQCLLDLLYLHQKGNVECNAEDGACCSPGTEARLMRWWLAAGAANATVTALPSKTFKRDSGSR